MKNNFSFLFPVMQAGSTRENYFQHIADFEVKGYFICFVQGASEINNNYQFKIQSITYEGKDIFPLLGAFTTITEVEAACKNNIEYILEQMSVTGTPKVISIIKNAGKVITLGKFSRARNN